MPSSFNFFSHFRLPLTRTSVARKIHNVNAPCCSMELAFVHCGVFFAVSRLTGGEPHVSVRLSFWEKCSHLHISGFRRLWNSNLHLISVHAHIEPYFTKFHFFHAFQIMRGPQQEHMSAAGHANYVLAFVFLFFRNRFRRCGEKPQVCSAPLITM